MNVKLLDYFSEWFATNSALLGACEATVEVSQQLRTDQLGVYADVDFDGGELVGRVTLWATGECELEAVYPSSGNFILFEKHSYDTMEKLDAGLRRFFVVLKRLEGT